MSQIMEVERIEQGDWNTAGTQTRKYVRLIGRDMQGRFCKAVCFSPVAESIVATMQRHLQPNEDLQAHRFMMTLEGEWKSKKREGRPGSDRAFMFERFSIMTGPSVVLNRALKDGAVSLNQAAAFLKAGSLPDAYRVLEKFVAEMTSQPAPSIDHDEIFDSLDDDDNDSTATYEPGNSPEDLAIRKMAAQDARSVVASPAAVAEQVFGNLTSATTNEAELVDEAEIAQALTAAEQQDAPAATAEEISEPDSETVEEQAAVEETAPEAVVEEPAPETVAAEAVVEKKTTARPAVERPPVLPSTAKPVDDADEAPAQPSRPAPIPRGAGFNSGFVTSGFKPFAPGR